MEKFQFANDPFSRTEKIPTLDESLLIDFEKRLDFLLTKQIAFDYYDFHTGPIPLGSEEKEFHKQLVEALGRRGYRLRFIRECKPAPIYVFEKSFDRRFF